ncbi:DUF2167 domain-containing protein, partial [Enterococcus faecalis]|uniref:DUF2167 domain-containing protein n=1 Tax=Enterococcus faecalis TaxID=1351 RepID=UPI00403F3379
PRYEPKFDRLAMAAHVIQHSQGDGAQDSARLDAYLFGRDGVLGLSLTAHPGGYANLHHHVDQLVSGASFLPGKRYADAVASDKRSDYPLEML